MKETLLRFKNLIPVYMYKFIVFIPFVLILNLIFSDSFITFSSIVSICHNNDLHPVLFMFIVVWSRIFLLLELCHS